jgi:hypothetical protein
MNKVNDHSGVARAILHCLNGILELQVCNQTQVEMINIFKYIYLQKIDIEPLGLIRHGFELATF